MAGFAGEKGQGLGSQPVRMVGGVEGRQRMARLPGRDVQDAQVFMSGLDHHALGLAVNRQLHARHVAVAIHRCGWHV